MRGFEDLLSYDGVLLDLDGTIFHEEHALPGAMQLIRRLQAARHPYACLTNSTSSPERLVGRLRRMGVDVDPASIYTAAAATVDYVIRRFGPERSARVFNLSSEGVQEMLEGRVTWVESAAQACDVVIVGVPLNVYATDERQRQAMILLRNGAQLVGICADRVYPTPRGLELGVGALAAMLAYSAGIEPVFCGKPEPLFFDEVCRRLAVAPERCVLIGDNLESDIAGARRAGMRAVLVLSGVSTRADALTAPAELQPHEIIDDLLGLSNTR